MVAARRQVLFVGLACLLACLALLASISSRSERAPAALEYKPPWEQTPTHFNRYRFARKGGALRQQLAQDTARTRSERTMARAVAHDKAAKRSMSAARAGKKALEASPPRAPGVTFLTGKQIVGNMWKALKFAQHKAGTDAAVPKPGEKASQRFRQALVAKYKKASGLTKLGESEEADAGAEDEEDEEAIDVNDDPPAGTVYVYRGRETVSGSAELLTFILAGGMEVEDIKYIEDSSDVEMRKALWDEECGAVVFPPMMDIPDFGPNAVKDLRAYVSKGFNNAGTVLFMGSSVETHVINQVFGYQLAQDYKPGPYYKNERGVKGTALETLPSRVNELGQTQSLGILKASMPPETNSFYDSFGSSVAMCVRYDLGKVCYLAQDFKPLEAMPDLEVQLESEDEEEAFDAERKLEALARKTDTWLSIFQGMIAPPDEE